jgi:hypothetical protein
VEQEISELSHVARDETTQVFNTSVGGDTPIGTMRERYLRFRLAKVPATGALCAKRLEMDNIVWSSVSNLDDPSCSVTSLKWASQQVEASAGKLLGLNW